MSYSGLADKKFTQPLGTTLSSRAPPSPPPSTTTPLYTKHRVHNDIEMNENLIFVEGLPEGFVDLRTGWATMTMGGSGGMSEYTSTAIVRNLVAAVDVLHYKNLAHRNLTPENVLIGTDLSVKVK